MYSAHTLALYVYEYVCESGKVLLNGGYDLSLSLSLALLLFLCVYIIHIHRKSSVWLIYVGECEPLGCAWVFSNVCIGMNRIAHSFCGCMYTTTVHLHYCCSQENIFTAQTKSFRLDCNGLWFVFVIVDFTKATHDCCQSNKKYHNKSNYTSN